jgi:hypothetical protein
MTETILSLEDKIERKKQIQEIVRDMTELGAEFEAVSEGRKSITNRAKALGLNKAGFQFAVKLSEMDLEKRTALVATLIEVADALAMNLQLTLDLGGPDDDTGNEDEQDGDDGKITAIRGALESVA